MTSHQEIEHLWDIPVELQVELDRKSLTIGAILDLKQGTVMKMNRSAGENIDIRAGGILIAYGEIVIVEDTMSVRITDFKGEN